MRYTFFIVLMLVICVSASYALSMKGAVMILPFDEGSGKVAKDISGNKNDGALMGDASFVAGKYGKAVKVTDGDGGNMVVVKANATLDVTDAITFGGWVMMETAPDSHCSLITKADTYMIHQSNWSGKGMEQEPLLWPFDAWQTPISTPIQFKEWKHVIGTFDGKTLKTYLDGQLKGERAFGAKIAVTPNDVVIGRDSRGCCNARKATQTFDEIVIFNRALSADEVKELMAGATTAVRPEGSASTLWGQIKSE